LHYRRRICLRICPKCYPATNNLLEAIYKMLYFIFYKVNSTAKCFVFFAQSICFIFQIFIFTLLVIKLALCQFRYIYFVLAFIYPRLFLQVTPSPSHKMQFAVLFFPWLPQVLQVLLYQSNIYHRLLALVQSLVSSRPLLP